MHEIYQQSIILSLTSLQFLVQLDFPSIIMNQEITEYILKLLASQPFVKYAQILTRVFPQPLINQFTKCLLRGPSLLQAKFDLIFSITLQRQASTLIQYEKLSNIVQGFIIYESANFQEKIQIKKQELKELKIIGFLLKQHPLSEIKQTYLSSGLKKKSKYANKTILAMKAKVLRESAPISSEKMQVQSHKPKSEPPKALQKIAQKSENINTKAKQQQLKLKPLEKKSSKDVQSSKPVQNPLKRLMGTMTQDEVEQGKQSNKRILKMNIQSDEEYYDQKVFNKMMEIEDDKGRQTDYSGKKKENEANQHLQQIKQRPSKFIVDDDEDEDQDLFAKMDQADKKRQTPNSQSQTQQKPLSKPVASQPPKSQTQPKKQPIVSNGLSKGLMGWLKK